MTNNRDYTDQVVNFLKSEAKKKKATSFQVTEDFFKSAEFKNAAKAALAIISDVLGYPVLKDADFEEVFTVAYSEFISNNRIVVLPSSSLKKSRKASWLTERRYDEIKWNYTKRYFAYMKRNGRSEKIINEVYNSSKKILEKLGDPKSNEEFYVKGLVVGSVQSGKTANFNAVINRAIDSGYGLIIVLSGIMEDLRSQTQTRIEREISGTGKNVTAGVGAEKKFGEMGDSSVHQVVVPTSVHHDFKKTIKEADFYLGNKNILVCKKNTSVLKNLILWLAEYLSKDKTKHDIPFLVIDDEADNASLNNMGNKGKEYASKVNGMIRALLALFTRKSYLGYTATPFANILQDRNDAPETKWIIDYKDKGEIVQREFDLVDRLFPDDFIELLFPPSNYIGAKHFFETRIEDIKKIDPLIVPAVTDYQNAFPIRVDRSGEQPIAVAEDNIAFPRVTKDDNFPTFLPLSLKEAIQCFIISVAIRLSRKSAMIGSKLYNPYNTMLIHISRFTAWQTRTKILVEKYVNDVLVVRLNTDLPNDAKSIYAEFERTWFKYYTHVIDNIKSYLPEGYEDDFLIAKNFDRDIKPLLIEAIKGVEIKAVNSETKDSLIYPDNTEKKYIAIGGNRLSRGFTLEGLTINYFIRSTDYADTLLQMGRWFGYRPGYLDCCKLFTTAANIAKFDLTTTTIEELEQEFRTMSRYDKTPREFVLRVKNHPKVLKITRASILKNTVEEKVNFSGDIEQSTKFVIDRERIENAWNSFREHVKQINWTSDKKDEFFIYKTDSKGLMDFLRLSNSFYGFDMQGLPEYLKLCNENKKLTDWTIAVKRNPGAGKSARVLSAAESNLPGEIHLTVRRGPQENTDARKLLITRNIFKASGKSAQIVAAGSDFSLTLSPVEKTKAETDFRAEKAKDYVAKGSTSEEASEEARKTTVPDKAYRMAMDEKDGILIIYVIDTAKIFEFADGKTDEELHSYPITKGINPKIPLVGYAIGFPRVSGDIGGTYIRGDYELDNIDEESEQDDFDDSLTDESN